jgi:hypothetical protein
MDKNMEIKDWETSLNHLITMRDKMTKDVEEQTYMIECYEKKIASLKNKGGLK